jgi:hypothetical protein
MRVNGTPTRTLWPVAGERVVAIIDQTALPHAYRVVRLQHLDDAARAILSMQVRGAPLIGVTAAYGVALALGERRRRRDTAGGRPHPGGDPPDCSQPALGADAHAGTHANAAAASARADAAWFEAGGSPTRTWTSVAGSAFTACRCCAMRVVGQSGGSRS